MSTLQQKIDKLMRFANNPSATPAERESYAKRARELREKMGGKTESTPKTNAYAPPNPSRSAAQPPKWAYATWDTAVDANGEWDKTVENAAGTASTSTSAKSNEDLLRDLRDFRAFWDQMYGSPKHRTPEEVLAASVTLLGHTDKLDVKVWHLANSRVKTKVMWAHIVQFESSHEYALAVSWDKNINLPGFYLLAAGRGATVYQRFVRGSTQHAYGSLLVLFGCLITGDPIKCNALQPMLDAMTFLTRLKYTVDGSIWYTLRGQIIPPAFEAA